MHSYSCFSIFVVCSEKIHCVWLSDGELQVLFHCKETDSLLSTHVKHISNQTLVQDYLDQIEFIPHFKRIITMEPTAGLSIGVTERTVS